MRKIAILDFSYTYGGVNQYTQSIVDAFQNDKNNYYVIFCSTNETKYDNYNLEVRKIDIKERFLTRIVRIFELITRLRVLKLKNYNSFKDIDLIVSPIASVYPHIYLNIPFVFTLHDLQEEYYPQFFSKKELFFRRLYNSRLCEKAESIICESNYVKNDIIKFYKVAEDKIYIVESPPPNSFINSNILKSKNKTVIEKHKLPKEYLYYPAQTWYHKNHINLLKAFRLLSTKYPQLFLILSGSKQNNHTNILKYIKDHNLKVKHLGYIDYDDLPYIYTNSKMLVLPTLFESISIPIWEAFSLGVPVCSSNAVALPEQVGDAGILFNPKDPNDIFEKIKTLLDDSKQRERIIIKGKDKVQKFNHENYCKKLLKVIDV
jgi:glycosyltransferase involved in cell wall biosynthesis